MKAPAVAGVVGALLAATAAPSLAHHSFAMFDLKKIDTVEGTVTRVRWSMPHVWVYASVPNVAGQMEEWGFECHAPNLIARKGWKSSSLKPGDKVTIRHHPMRDGSKEGSMISVRLPSGETLRNADSDFQP
jgi:hypothetical protein